MQLGYETRMTDEPYVLHYAPDNASLIIRLALEEINAPYCTRLVDRRIEAQKSEAYRALNPMGLIPALETPEGPLFETGAILLWLAERHHGLTAVSGPPHDADTLKWLFYLSNTLHPALRMLFYPSVYIGTRHSDQQQLIQVTQTNVCRSLTLLNSQWKCTSPGLMHDIYLAPMLRWLALYPQSSDKNWFQLARYPALMDMAARLETRPSVHAAQSAEGLGPTPFTAPILPVPPEGSAL